MDSTTYSVEYAYDANSNRTSIKYPDGISFTYRYDGRDSLTQLKRGSLVLVSYASDSHGRPKSQTTAGNATATLNYDTVSRVNEIKHNFSGTGYDLTLGFAYNPASQLVTQNLSNGRFYHQGRTAQTGTYSVNGLNQYTKIDDKTITHDANGNFKSDSVTNYTYDVENRLISVVGAHNGLLHYDPMGRLYKINAHDTGKTTYFLYSGDSLIAEYQSGQMTQRYVHGGGGLAPRVGYDGSSTAAAYLRFLHTNHQGSVIAQSNNSGAVTNINTYDEYGVPGTGNAGRFSYTGQMHLPEIGLYHYRARMYNPFTGRFLQTDPVGYADQMNLYAYVHNDPLNYTDPTGEFACGGICIGIAIAVVSASVSVGTDAVVSEVTNTPLNGADVARNATVAAVTSPIKGIKTVGAAAIAGSSEIAGGMARGDSPSKIAGNALAAATGAAAGTAIGNSRAGQMLAGKVGDAFGDAGKQVAGENAGNLGFAVGQAAGTDVSGSAVSSTVSESVRAVEVRPTSCPTGNPHC